MDVRGMRGLAEHINSTVCRFPLFIFWKKLSLLLAGWGTEVGWWRTKRMNSCCLKGCCSPHMKVMILVNVSLTTQNFQLILEICHAEIAQSRGGGGYFTINSYGGVRRKDFCYDPIPEIWSDIDTQSQKICQILIPNRRSNKSNSTSKG